MDQQTKGDHAGGYDALAIRFSADIVNHNAAVIIWPGEWGGAQPYPERYPASLHPQPEDNSEAGASFRFKDKLFKDYCSGTDHPSCWNYLGAGGLVGVSFTRIPGTTGCIQVFSKYGHTWSSTSVSSVDLSNTHIGFTFTKNKNRWDISSERSGQLDC